MRYVVTGATSNTGNAVVARLARKAGAARITCLVRPTSNTRLVDTLGIATHVGDVMEPRSYQSLLSGDTIFLNMTGARHYEVSLSAAVEAGVKRAYFITTTGIFSRFRQCAEVYIENEKRIRDSGIIYTILRPSMIYGSIRDRNMSRLIRFLDRWPVFPLFGEGTNLMQPVFVDDLADSVVAAIDNARTENQEYNLAGPDPIPYRDMIGTILAQLGRRVRLVSVNPSVAYQLVRWAEWTPYFPLKGEQVLRMTEDKAFDISRAVADLGHSPRSFESGIASEIGEMRKAGRLRSAPCAGGRA